MQIWAILITAVLSLGISGCQMMNSEKTSPTPVTPVSTALDGRFFSIQLVKEGKIDDKDTLIFDKGAFDSTVCRKYGYELTSYITKKAGTAMTYEAISKSKKYGHNTWRGKIEGDKISGTMVWNNGQKKVNYTYSGTLNK